MSRPRRLRRRVRTREHKLRERVATAIRETVNTLLPEMTKLKIPKSKANWGFCEDVAIGARDLLEKRGITAIVVRDDDELRTTTHEIYGDGGWTHAWIWVEGKHHDFDAIYGARRWLDLPHFRGWLAPWGDDELNETGDVDIDPVLNQGREQRMFFRSAVLLRSMNKSIAKHLRALEESSDA